MYCRLRGHRLSASPAILLFQQVQVLGSLAGREPLSWVQCETPNNDTLQTRLAKRTNGDALLGEFWQIYLSQVRHTISNFS